MACFVNELAEKLENLLSQFVTGSLGAEVVANRSPDKRKLPDREQVKVGLFIGPKPNSPLGIFPPARFYLHLSTCLLPCWKFLIIT